MKIFSSLTAILLALFCFSSYPAAAQDYASWIQFSDSSDNSLIAEMIRQGDLSIGLEAAEALGLRRDAQIDEIILAVGEIVDPRPVWERELLLRTLVHSVFSPAMDSSELVQRLRMNREGIDFLVTNLPGYGLSLRREIIRILGFLDPPNYRSTLMFEGRALSELLLAQRGELTGEQAGLAITYLETVNRIGDPEFGEVVLLILEGSRHIEVAEKARLVSRTLLLR